MNTPEQHIRQILDAARFPVDPQHEAAFLQMLVSDKRDRRLRGWLLLAFMFILFTLGATLAYFALRKPAVPAISPASHHEQPIENALHRGAATLQPSDDRTDSAADRTNDTSETASSPASQNTVSATDTEMLSSTSQSVQAGSSSTSSSLVSGNTPTRGTGSRNVNAVQPAVESAPTWSETLAADDTQQLSNSATELAEASSPRIALHDLIAIPMLHSEPLHYARDIHVANAASIIPAHRLSAPGRVHYGVSGTTFVAGQLLQDSPVSTGIGMQAGGYATYRLSPFTILRADAGFSLLDGGFTFTKESESEVYGFSSTIYNNMLQVDRLYSGFFGLEGGLIRGNKTFVIGVQGLYTYGARGAVHVLAHPADAPEPIVTSTENVWLSTTGLSRVSVSATTGIRMPLTRRIELGALLRIPVLGTVRTNTHQNGYFYTIQSPGIAPQLMLSYQINQR